MIPRTQYRYGQPSGNHCPFFLSQNWHGLNRTLGEQAFALLGLGLGIILSVLTGLLLMKLITMAGLKALFPWPHFIALGLAVWAGYKFYFWFIDYEFKRPKNQN